MDVQISGVTIQINRDDEAHTLIGAGGLAWGGNTANLLKPDLARGEFRAVAATTWSEYKKYVEKDPALTRRFHFVKLNEPSEVHLGLAKDGSFEIAFGG